MSATFLILSATIMAVAVANVHAADDAKPGTPGTAKGPLDFTLKANDGTPYDLAKLRGKVVLLVNTASKCGLTPQYAELQALHTKYQERGLVIVAVPANDFGAQEPGTDAEIRTFCTTYQVGFPLMSKVSVKGDDIHPLFRWLAVDGPKPGPIAWNFTKFLIGRDGSVIGRFEPKTAPASADVTSAVDLALGK